MILYNLIVNFNQTGNKSKINQVIMKQLKIMETKRLMIIIFNN